MPSGPSETETVIKRILPYMRRRGYDDQSDFGFETPAEYRDRYDKGYVDILVTCGRPQPQFLVEAKRAARAINKKDEKQAINYGKAQKVEFVVVTNGKDVRCLRTKDGSAIRWNGSLRGLIPTKHQLPGVIKYLRANPEAQDIPLGDDESLPFRPGLPLRQLNRLFAKCHTWIRNIEKAEDDSFADFSKILFLKLLEEKADAEEIELPYSYRFWQLAQTPPRQADQVKNAIGQMLDEARKIYGPVLGDPLKLTKSATFLKIVTALSGVSFADSEADVKGASFEYFVRATLKGKKLGQFFTPRPLVQLMVAMIGPEVVTNALMSSTPITVIDPACGTGGFLVFMMRDAIGQLEALQGNKRINAAIRAKLEEQVKRDVFFGAEANAGVASAAKMNMIIAGDGHANVRCEDSLASKAKVWDHDGGADIVLTNPPFGTSELDSLEAIDPDIYEVETSKGQLLFLQRMLRETKSDGLICTVIDEGVLNTETATEVRRLVLERTRVRAVVRLPEDTFKPNKINVRSAVLLLEKRAVEDPNLTDNYPVRFIDLASLGFDGSGAPVRGFDFQRLLGEIGGLLSGSDPPDTGYYWSTFTVPSTDITGNRTVRLDLKYWVPSVVERVEELEAAEAPTVATLNQREETTRGKSPPADSYVDVADGYARVLKAGSSITSFGEIAPPDEQTDYIEQDAYDETPEKSKVQRDDILLASTGTGTLGKAAVYESDEPAVADGHITIIRVNRDEVSPRYLADYLRAGFGRVQIERLYTGSTGLIELSPQEVDAVRVELPDADAQQRFSDELRQDEAAYRTSLEEAEARLAAARRAFGEATAVS